MAKREVKFESQDRRIAQINKVLNSYGIASIEEAEAICDAKGIDPYLECEQTQNICFENAKWAYVVGAAIAIKKNCIHAADAAEAIGEGLQAFCIPGSVADDRKVGIGHGNLAERALIPVLPDQAEFPYTIRCVSEVLSSNGSTSQASICGSTLALMDAGVPIKAPVAGISCGLITDGDPLHGGRWMTMLDIQGVEDFHGDMDFKVGGTRKGITAIQMDIKIDGLTYDIIAEAFEKCRKGRLYILDEIIKPVIAEPRRELSRWAPKMFSMMIPTDKIKDVIGKGGKVIQDICATCNCKIDVQEDGHVFVSAVDQEDAKRAIFTIRTIVEDPEIGAIYKGKVTRLMNFGAFVEIAPGKEGLVHISKLDTKRVERVEDVVAVGDAIVVKVTDIDQQGRINLSRRDAILALEAKKAQQEQG